MLMASDDLERNQCQCPIASRNFKMSLLRPSDLNLDHSDLTVVNMQEIYNKIQNRQQDQLTLTELVAYIQDSVYTAVTDIVKQDWIKIKEKEKGQVLRQINISLNRAIMDFNT